MRKYARLIVAGFVIAFGIFVARQLKQRTPEVAPPPVARTDPGAVVESTGGQVFRFDSSREAFTVYFDRQLAYENG